jgi:superfamily II DNA or RNA helicase
VLRHIGRPVLILAPLAVAAQTVAEGAEIGIDVIHVRDQSGVSGPCIYITNYDRLHLFDASAFGALVLDESSCIKHHTAKMFAYLCEAFRNTPYKLCATATPAPNDWTELGTHAEFLGICTRAEMLAEYFIHDGAETQVWRLKGHARAQFWRWVSTWGAMVRRPSDLGFDDSRYELPPLSVHQHTVLIPNAAQRVGMLFAMEAQTLSERRDARKESIADRVKACADLVNADDERWLVWCDLNAESEALTNAIRGAVEVKGADESDHKESALTDFAAGRIRVLVSKPSIAGWGMNFQRCARIAFVGVTDSWESYYQAVRRCWRFGQMRPVEVHIFSSDLEGAVVANLRRKEADALAMAESLSAETREAVIREVVGLKRETNTYNAARRIAVPSWLRSEAA